MRLGLKRLWNLRNQLAMGSLAAAMIGCSDGGSAPGQGTLSFEIAAGDGQVGVVDQPLPNPLVVRVHDENNRPINGQVVNFVVVKGGGSVFAGAASTNSDGLAQEIWTLGQLTRDTQQVEVRAVDAATGEPHVYATFNATPRAGPPYEDGFVLDTLWSAVGLPVQEPYFGVADEFGNPVPGATASFVVTAGGGSVAASPLVTDPTGAARPIWTLGPTAGFESQELTITSEAPFHFGGAPVVVVRMSAYTTADRELVVVSGDNQSAPAGSQLAQRLVVKVVDGSEADLNDNLTYPMNVEFTSGGGSYGDSNDLGLPNKDCFGSACYLLVKLGPNPGQNTFTVSVYGIGEVVLTATGT